MALADIPVVVARDAEPAKTRSVSPPARASTEPYRAYKPRPFTREERIQRAETCGCQPAWSLAQAMERRAYDLPCLALPAR